MQTQGNGSSKGIHEDESSPQQGNVSSGASSSPLIDDIARVLERHLGIDPGRDCVVGEGIATAHLGLFVDDRQVAVAYRGGLHQMQGGCGLTLEV